MNCWRLVAAIIIAFCGRSEAGLPTPTKPILLVIDSLYTANPFARYLSEILLSEGLVQFQEVELSALAHDSHAQSFLNAFQVILLAESELPPAEEQLFRQYVFSGGSLIAMRPDRDLSDLFGIVHTGIRAEQLQQFFALDTSAGPGVGLFHLSMQYHGQADDYILKSAIPLAYLWDSIDTPSASPAVVLHSYGNGQAAAFTFDLARSIVLMRQGNLAWENTDGNGDGDYTPVDMFFQTDGSTWLALERWRVPQADEQQRFLANLIMSLSSQPLPRLWYLPDGKKCIMVNTGDAEDMGGAQLDSTLNDAASYGGTFTVYLREIGIAATDPQRDALWRAAGHEVGVHTYAGRSSVAAQEAAYQQITSNLFNKFGHLSRTARSHTIDWCGWVDMARIEASYGTELDCNYYHYPPAWAKHEGVGDGYLTGSGLPQRFCDDENGILPIYQILTQWPDEWFADSGYTVGDTVQVIREMFAAAENGYYSAFVNNIHPVRYIGALGSIDPITPVWPHEIWAYCQSNGIPMMTAEKLLNFTKARNAAQFNNITWNGTMLSFDFVTPHASQDLTLMVPAWANSNQISTLTFSGAPVACSIQIIKGRAYTIFKASAGGQVIATYLLDVAPPTILNLRVEGVGSVTATVAWDTSELASSRVQYGLSPGALNQQNGSTGLVVSHRLQFDGLQPNTIYFYQVTSTDQGGNLTNSEVLSFSTTPRSWVLTTATDFQGGDLESVIVTEDGDGEVRLPAALYDSFRSDSLGSNWISGAWSGGGYNPVVSNGAVTVSNPGGGSGGARVYSAAPFLPGMTLQGRIKFSRGGGEDPPFMYFGLAGPNLLPWALIGTGYDGGQIYVSVYNERPGDPAFVSLGNIFEQWHDYKMVWESGRIEFWMDGVLRRAENVSMVGPLHVFFSTAGSTPLTGSVSADWVRVETYQSTLLLSDSFSVPDGPAANWIALSNGVPSVGDWSIANNRLVHSTGGTSYHPVVLDNNYPFLENYNLQVLAESSDTVFGLVWGLQDGRNFYMAQFSSTPGVQGMRIYRVNNWSFALLADVPSAPVPIAGQWFTLRLEARSGVFRIYVEGILQASINNAAYPVGRVGLLGYGSDSSQYDNVLVENITGAASYESGVYTSPVFDAGWKFNWETLVQTGTTPPSAETSFQTRSGNTPTPDSLWSAWQLLTSPISSPPGRFFQFQARLSTTNSLLRSPIIERVQLNVTSTHEEPQLDLAFSDQGTLTLRWPAWASGLTLFSTTNVTPPVIWKPCSYGEFIWNGFYQYALPATNSMEFFRLAHPIQ